jgi:hypothetical protein
VFRVRTNGGREVETTLTHPFLTPSGWEPLGRWHPARSSRSEASPGLWPRRAPRSRGQTAGLPLQWTVAANPRIAEDFADAFSGRSDPGRLTPSTARYAPGGLGDRRRGRGRCGGGRSPLALS